MRVCVGHLVLLSQQILWIQLLFWRSANAPGYSHLISTPYGSGIRSSFALYYIVSIPFLGKLDDLETSRLGVKLVKWIYEALRPTGTQPSGKVH